MKGIAFSDLMVQLATMRDFPFRKRRRIARVEKVGSDWLVLILSVKDQQRFLELSEGDDDFEINEHLVGNLGLVDFNYCAFNETSGKGTYLGYRTALSLSGFGRLLSKCFRAQRKEVRDRERADKVRAKDRQELSDKLEFVPLIEEAKFEELLEEMSLIKRVDVTFGTEVLEEVPQYKPISGNFVRAVTAQVAFKKDAVDTVKDALRGLVGNRPSGMKVRAVDAQGLSRTLDIFTNESAYETFLFDTLVDGVTIQPSSISANSIARTVLECHKNHL